LALKKRRFEILLSCSHAFVQFEMHKVSASKHFESSSTIVYRSVSTLACSRTVRVSCLCCILSHLSTHFDMSAYGNQALFGGAQILIQSKENCLKCLENVFDAFNVLCAISDSGEAPVPIAAKKRKNTNTFREGTHQDQDSYDDVDIAKVQVFSETQFETCCCKKQEHIIEDVEAASSSSSSCVNGSSFCIHTSVSSGDSRRGSDSW
jgi:hypothetical protein